MTKIVLNQAALIKLKEAREKVEICDESGKTLGVFTPVENKALYEGVNPPITAEELDRREMAGGGRTLAEILADLEKRS